MSTGTVPSTGPAVDATALATTLLSGDGTYSLTGRRYNGSGILVAISGTGLVLPADVAALIPNSIAAWVKSNAAPAILSRPAPFHNPRFLGSWTDSETGTLYLDVVEAFPREDLSEAIAAGAARDQIAIWDNGRGELIATNGTGAVA